MRPRRGEKQTLVKTLRKDVSRHFAQGKVDSCPETHRRVHSLAMRVPLLTLLLALAPFSLHADPEKAAPPTPAGNTPFRLLFNSYDGDPKGPGTMTFQVNTVDLKQPSSFIAIGDMISKTKLKLERFTHKTRRNEQLGEDEDVSELTVKNVETGKFVILILGKSTDVAAIMDPAPK